MYINSLNNYSINFKAAQLNILATSDNHGSIATIPNLIKSVQENKEDIFQKSEQPSTLNLFAIAGDYFMHPKKNGLATKKNEIIGDLQFRFLTKMIKSVNEASGENSNFDTVFTLGNHDLDAGDKWVLNKLKNSPVTTIMTNVNLVNSPYVRDLMAHNDNIVISKTYEIPDDSNPDMKDHVLVLGLTIPRKKYNGKKLEGTQFYDFADKSTHEMMPDDFSKTIKKVSSEIEQFKSKHPDGAVILMSHLGNPLSEMFAKNIPEIDVILNAHDHKKKDVIVGDTLISSLGENNEIIKSINIKFDDYGKVASIDKLKFKTIKYASLANEDKELQDFVFKNIRKDIKPLFHLNIPSDIGKQLEFNKNIRSSNSILVNYITSALKEAAQVAYPSIDIVGIPSKIFMGGLKRDDKCNEFTNLDLIKMFGGANAEFVNLTVGEVTGTELVQVITENVLKNLENPKGEGIIHWSDIQVNKTLISQIMSGESELHFIDAVKIKNPETKKFEELNPYKMYTVMLPNKHLLANLNQSQIKTNFKNKFHPINATCTSLFQDYVELVNHQFELKDEVFENRII